MYHPPPASVSLRGATLYRIVSHIVALVVRPFELSDSGFVERVASDVFGEYSGAGAGARTLRMVFAPRTRTFIGEQAGRSVGFVAVEVKGDRAHLLAIAVVPDLRGRGVGQRLLTTAERSATERGARSVHLETGEANVEAMSLFVAAGYERVGRVPRYYDTGYDALRFVKKL